MEIKVNSESALALVRLVTPMIASVAAVFGWTLDAGILANVLISVVAVVLFIWSWWKNNNITVAAQEAQVVLRELKAGESASTANAPTATGSPNTTAPANAPDNAPVATGANGGLSPADAPAVEGADNPSAKEVK